ncbi:hypothetical protein J2W42_006838 [Rhizobium tibeticum]|nr:hypothetical protein [Rhizobium tibeticum]MDP9813961.1 hypothetical protein [Rhizobium tibeticum]
MAGLFVEDDAVSGDVDEEGTTAGELVVDVLQRMDDRDDRGFDAMADLLFQQLLFHAFPEFMLIGKGLLVDDDQQVVVGAVAAEAILDPVTPG